MEATVEFNKSQNHVCRIPCAGSCQCETRHIVLASVEYSGRFDGADWKASFQIVQCRGCERASFRQVDSNSEEYDEDLETGAFYPVEHVQLFPKRMVGRPNLALTHRFPRTISAIYTETHQALCNSQPIISGIGLRALLETICKDRSASGSNLEKKIDDLVRMGVLTTSGAEMLHSLRIMGNKAAHEVKPHDEETLASAFQVIENILLAVYVLPGIASSLRDEL